MKLKLDPKFLWTSMKKDMVHTFFPVMRVFFVIILIAFLTVMAFANTSIFTLEKPTNKHSSGSYDPGYDFYRIERQSNRGYYDYDDDDFWVERVYEERGASDITIPIFLIVFLPILIFLFIFHALAFSREKRTGNIRAYFHYPISLRKLVISKALNVSVMTLIFTLFLLFLTVSVMFAWDFNPTPVIATVIITYFITIFLYFFFFCLSSLIHKSRMKRSLIDPIALMSIGLGIFLLITESAIIVIHLLLCSLYNWNYRTPSLIALRYLSPIHTLGTIYEWIWFGNPMSILDLLWVPLFVTVMLFGIKLLKDVYPDVFIRESA